MRISRRFKRIVSAMLATALAFTMTFSTDVMPLADSKQDQLKAEVSAKQAELDKVNAALKEAQLAQEQGEVPVGRTEEPDFKPDLAAQRPDHRPAGADLP